MITSKNMEEQQISDLEQEKVKIKEELNKLKEQELSLIHILTRINA